MATSDVDTFWEKLSPDFPIKETSSQEYVDLGFYCFITKLRYLGLSGASGDDMRTYVTQYVQRVQEFEDIHPRAMGMYFEAMVILMGFEKASVSSDGLR
jgi:hypothetical protein